MIFLNVIEILIFIQGLFQVSFCSMSLAGFFSTLVSSFLPFLNDGFHCWEWYSQTQRYLFMHFFFQLCERSIFSILHLVITVLNHQAYYVELANKENYWCNCCNIQAVYYNGFSTEELHQQEIMADRDPFFWPFLWNKGAGNLDTTLHEIVKHQETA